MRFERKYRVTHLDAHEVREVIRAHPLSFRTAYPDRQVNNIYLDTLDLADFAENLRGLSQRRKFRVRWYGQDLLHVHRPVLEMKFKDAGLGDKRFITLDDFEWQGGPELRNILEAQLQAQRAQVYATQEAQGTGEMPPMLPTSGLRPALINTYLRSYFISMDGRFRVTIDRDLRFYNPDVRFHPNRNYGHDPAVIVEVKYDQQHDLAFDQVSRRLPFPISRNSKYVTGILLVGNR